MDKIQEGRMVLIEFLRNTAREKKITHEMISNRTGISRPNVSRILSGNFNVTLDNFLKIQDALGLDFPKKK